MRRASDELSIRSDSRKLTAQEKNLLRIRNLEREKQEGWEVMHAPEVMRPLQGLGGTP